MAVVVEIDVAGWTDITAYIPFWGDSAHGIQPFSMEKVRESNIGVLSFGMDSTSVNPNPGTEIRVSVDGTVRFGGYITTREQSRHGAATTMLSSNYHCQDYNSILDRIVVPSYTIDAGDTDSTEIETLRATYLAGIGVTAGTISTIDAAMPEITLSGTFRQCMEAICGAVGGAQFYINAAKQLNYGAGAWSATGVENLSDDLTVAFSHPYTNFVLRDDETRRVNAVYVIGNGVEGWYPDPPGANYYQMIINDPSVTTQALLDAVGAAIVDDFEYPLEEKFLTCWETDVWEYDEVTVRHSDLIAGAPSLWTRRSVARARTVDATELEFDLEFGDHTVESNYLGPSPTTSGGGMADHGLLASPYHLDTDDYTVTRGALIVGDSTPEWTGLAHPAAAGVALTTDANDTIWDQTPTWIGLHTFSAGWRISGGTGDMDGNDLILDLDADSYLHASGDDVVDLVLATASGEFGIHINGAEDFTVTANSINVLSGSAVTMADDTWIGLGAAAGRLIFNSTPAPDLITIDAANLDLDGHDLIIDQDGDSYLHASADDVVDIVLAGALGELGITINGAEDFTFTANAFNVLSGSDIVMADDSWIGMGAALVRLVFDSTTAPDSIILNNGELDLNGNDLLLDADADTYLALGVDDQVTLYIAGTSRYQFTGNNLIFNNSLGTDILRIRTHGDVTNTGADIWADSQMGLAADENVHIFIDANDNETTAYFSIRHDGEDYTTTAADELFRVTEAGFLGLMTTSTTNMTIGIKLDQGANTDDVLGFKSNITHGMTAHAETDMFGQFTQNSGTYGGLRVRGLRDSSSGSADWGALNLVGYLGEAADTTKTTAGRGVVEITSAVRNGATTGITAVGADGNLMTIRNNATTRFIFDAEGSGHSDIEWTTFDRHDDLALLGSLEAAFGDFAEGHRAELEALGIARFDDTPGHAMVNWTRLQMLLVGAARQMGARLDRLEGKLLEAGNA